MAEQTQTVVDSQTVRSLRIKDYLDITRTLLSNGVLFNTRITPKEFTIEIQGHVHVTTALRLLQYRYKSVWQGDWASISLPLGENL